MLNRSDRARRGYGGAVAVRLAFAASGLLAFSSAAWPLGGSDVTIENVTFKSQDGDTVSAPRVDFAKTNLSKDEIAALLSPDTPEVDERALIEKLKADRISAPSLEIAGKDGSRIHLHDLVASDVDAGRVAKLQFAALEGSGTSDGSPVSIKSGTLVVDDLDLADVLKAVGGSGHGRRKGRLDHLAWNAIDVVTQEASAQAMHIAVGSLEVHSGYTGDALKEGWTKLTGVVIEPSADSEEGKDLASLGYSRIELAVGVSADYKAEAKTFSLDNLTVEGAQMGSIAVKANFSDVPAQVFAPDNEGRLEALFDCGVASIEVRLVNSGLFEKAVALFAKQEGATPETLKQQWSAAIGQMAPLLLGGDPSTLKATAEAQKFIASPHNLTVSIKAKNGPIKATDFMAIGDPAAFAGKLDIAAAANQ